MSLLIKDPFEILQEQLQEAKDFSEKRKVIFGFYPDVTIDEETYKLDDYWVISRGSEAAFLDIRSSKFVSLSLGSNSYFRHIENEYPVCNPHNEIAAIIGLRLLDPLLTGVYDLGYIDTQTRKYVWLQKDQTLVSDKNLIIFFQGICDKVRLARSAEETKKVVRDIMNPPA